MSKYKVIQTEFRNPESLKKALTDLAVPFECARDPKVPSLSLYGYMGDERPERASFVIRRHQVNQHWSGGMSNDLGFAWDGQQFTVQISDYDSGKSAELLALDRLRQRYSFHEVHRQARAKGYTVRESRSVNGAIEMVLVKR